MSHENCRIPRTLDDPALLFLWELDTAVVFLIWVIVGAVLGGLGLLFGVFIGAVCTRGYTRLKEEGGRGLIAKMVYWFTPLSTLFSTQNPSHVREHIGRSS